jgi:oligopeptide transport system substrate-binding protein
VRSKRILATLLTVSLGASAALVGCKAEEKKPGEEAKGGMDQDQYLNILLESEPKSIDPSRSTDLYSSQVLSHINDGLTRIEQDENGKDFIAPGIAESWEHNEEGTVWTFHLRDAKWSDGQSVKAQDFEYGIKRTLDPNTGSNYAWLISPVIKNGDAFNTGKADADSVGVKAVDEKTLEITLESPVAYFLDLTYFKVMYPQRQDIVEKWGDAYGSEAEHMVACGPFVLKNWTHQNKLEFEKNSTYWDADSVKLDKLTMKIIKEENARMNELYNGSIDAATVTKSEWKEKFDAMGEFDYLSTFKPSASYGYFNQETRYFKNAKVRKAFILALDREGVASTLYRGLADPAYAWCPPTVQIGGEDFRDKADNLPIKKLMDENPDPKALLIEGLKELGEDPDPSKMEVTMLQSGTDARSREFAEFNQQTYMKVLGVQPKVEYMEWAIFNDRTHKMDYEMASAGWTGDYNDPNTFFEMYASTANVVPTGWKNDRYDELIKLASQTNDQAKRFEYFNEAENILLYEYGVISPWVYRKSSTYKRKYVKNLQYPLFGTVDCKYAYTEGRK